MALSIPTSEPTQTTSLPPPCAPGESDAEPHLSRAEIDALGEQIAETAAHLDAATHRLMTQIRLFDDAGGWYEQGALTCAHWLSWRIGMDYGAAREKLRVAHCLAKLPRIDEALRRAELSYSKVRAVTRVATPENEEALLQMARYMTASQLEKTCRIMRQQLLPERQHAFDEPSRRWVRNRSTEDGMVLITARLHPEEAARVQKAMEVSAESSDLADGLVAAAERALAATESPAVPAVEVTMTIDAGTLTGHTEGGLGISRQAARRLCCDAKIVPMTVDDQGQPLSVGRKTRVVPTALRPLR